jgi:hypothetical protein
MTKGSAPPCFDLCTAEKGFSQESGEVGMELLEKLPDVTVKGDGAAIVKHL